jgi:histone H2B
MNDMFDTLVAEAARLVRLKNAKTLSARDVQTSTRLLLPGALADHAVSEGTKAVQASIGRIPY